MLLEHKAAHDVLSAQTCLPLQIFWWEQGLKGEVRSMCSVDPVTRKQYIHIEKASAACACDAHLTSASAAAASHKHGPTSQPSARVDKGPNLPELRDAQVVAWAGTNLTNSPARVRVGWLNPSQASSGNGFCTAPVQATGELCLPQELLKDGKLPVNTCYYKGCKKPGHC